MSKQGITPKAKEKQVHFDLSRNQVHEVETLYNKGMNKPAALGVFQTRHLPIDMKEKRKIKDFLENHSEPYHGYILNQYHNMQNGNYHLSFIEPNSRTSFSQTFSQAQITDMLAQAKALKQQMY